MDSERKTIFKVICCIMFALGLIIYTMGFSLLVGNIFASVIAAMLILNKRTSTGFIEMFKWYKAKRKGKKYYGYIYEVIELDKDDDNIINEAKVLESNIGQDGLVRLIRKMSGIVVLKIILCDDVTMETTLIEYEITEGVKHIMYFSDEQYNYVYKYKDKYYLMPSDIIPKFIVPKNERFVIKNKLEEIVDREVQE